MVARQPTAQPGASTPHKDLIVHARRLAGRVRRRLRGDDGSGLVVDVDHQGTPEAVWRSSGRIEGLRPLDLGRWSRAVVVAPHPDDEVLGAGGLMQRLARGGVPIAVVAVTDGEASHPGSSAAAAIDLPSVRAEERTAALRRLLHDAPPVERLGLPDGRVTGASGPLRTKLEDWLTPGDVCVAPWTSERHPDHDAVGRAAIEASRNVGCDIINYLVWAWHWATPDGEDLPWEDCRRLDLTRRDAARKRWATMAFLSQIRPLGPDRRDGPVLPDGMLRRSWRTSEVYIVGADGRPLG